MYKFFVAFLRTFIFYPFTSRWCEAQARIFYFLRVGTLAPAEGTKFFLPYIIAPTIKSYRLA